MEADVIWTAEDENTGEFALVMELPNGEMHHIICDRTGLIALANDLLQMAKFDA